MIAIEQLCYVRLGTRDLKAAVDFSERMLGLQLVDKSNQSAYFRSDFRDHTIVYFHGDTADRCVGFEIRGPAELKAAIAELLEHGLKVRIGTDDECALRRVRSLASFNDPCGTTIELVVRPQNSGWRYFPARDAGIVGLSGVALRTIDVPACETLWTKLFNGRVSDWVGDASFLRFDRAHHRLAYYPSKLSGVFAMEFAVENVDLLMQNSYFLQASQVKIVHGPGRRPTSNQIFITFVGPDDMLFSYVTEGDLVSDVADHRPRQFPRARSSFCAWGSESKTPEFM